MDKRLDLSLLEAKLPKLGVLPIPADLALCEDDYESDYSNPPLLVTSSQCCSPTLSPSTFDNDEFGSIITDPLPSQTELPVMSAIRHIDSFTNLTDTKKTSQTATQLRSHKRRTRPSSTRTKTVSIARPVLPLLAAASTQDTVSRLPIFSTQQINDSLNLLFHISLFLLAPNAENAGLKSINMANILITLVDFGFPRLDPLYPCYLC
ncbi:hypothetical protein FRC14_008201 [Serendipita sp. 396]|nr:hypothetical protein FRC14_008201 [Serendipita sp. 396]KAG8786322.1 hypothetical protein FRC15_011639 [Serendipita sp. 397]KAG8801617.1 hypothetical protein FRC16_011448 [Serendipita sp. 398]KAG8817677.1 hypothetical protein FRC19_011212 [Serendipita sp. 401]KAG8820709.1 hypothetical protein FRC18_011629 [Serendipita sp. 400]KAG8870338.1 hypothetical protein FRC20_011987 [Serendipita sp. 405]KAG9047759.1 hypothetical protein FS842_000579 [Serendipita sp. 407]